MTAADKAELMALIRRLEPPDVPHWFVAALLGMGGLGFVALYYAITEVLPWH